MVSAAFVVDLVVQEEHPEEGQEGACVSQLVCDQQYTRIFLESSVGVLEHTLNKKENNKMLL